MAKPGRNEKSLIEFEGKMITVEDRNELMKRDFIMGMNLKDISLKYGLTYNTVRVMSCNNNWKDAKAEAEKTVKQKTEDIINDYVGDKAEIQIELYLKWKKYGELADEIMQTKQGLLDKDGQLSVYKVNQLGEILDKYHTHIADLVGLLGPAELEKLKQAERQIAMKEQMLGLGAEDVIEDNFLAALNAVAIRQFGDDIGND